MKKIIIFISLLLAFTTGAATFEFKDGTVVKGTIYYNSTNLLSMSNPTPNGIFIKTLDNKIYVHHYPMVESQKEYQDNGGGTYTSTIIPRFTIAPPIDDGLYDNPPFMPNCAPARINFFYFSKKTQKELYKDFFNLTRHYATTPSGIDPTVFDRYGPLRTIALLDAKNTALSIHAHINGTAYIPKTLNTPARSKKWQDKVEAELSFSKYVAWKRD